jgi:branched-chain amino acid transport system permease protein
MLSGAAFLQFLFSGIVQGSVYALIALGFMVIYNASGIINFAQGEFIMLGGMLTVTLYHGAGLPLVVAIPLAVAIVTVSGVAFEHLAIRPLKDASSFSLIMVTIGASILLRGLAFLIWRSDDFSLPYFVAGKPLLLGGATLLPHNLIVLLTALGLMLALQLFFSLTPLGQAMRASAANPKGASLCGIRPETMAKLSFGISAALGSISGIIITPTHLTGYNVGSMLGLKGFVVAIIGGLNSFVGTVAGGFLLGITEALSAGYISSQYKDAITFALMILLLFMKPNGILGRKTN